MPFFSMALEYQGEIHYASHLLFGSHKPRSQRDREKRMACYTAGITLIEVPFWWDTATVKSKIVQQIRNRRPDLLQ